MELPNWADESCSLNISHNSLRAIDSGKVKIFFKKHGDLATISNLVVDFSATRGNFQFFIGGNHTSLKIGQISGNYQFRLWRRSVVSILDGTTCNGARLFCDNSSIFIGNDCMFSDEIVIQSSDQHGIVDISKKEIVNNNRTRVDIGDHVWVGRRSNIMYGTNLGAGSIVGFGSLVNRSHPENCLVAGVPATTKKENITWSRNTDTFDLYSRRAVTD